MTVVVTRPGSAGLELTTMLEKNNIAAIHFPLFTFTDGEELHLLTHHLDNLTKDDWVFPVSTQAIEFAHKELQRLNKNWPTDIKYLAVGKKSAEKLCSLTKQKILYPSQQENSEGLIKLLNKQELHTQKILILRAENGRELFSDFLHNRGTEVITLCCYNRKPIIYNKLRAFKNLVSPVIFIVTSQTNLIALHQLLVDNHFQYSNTILITVSARIALIAKQLGWKNIQICEKVNNQILYNTVQSIIR